MGINFILIVLVVVLLVAVIFLYLKGAKNQAEISQRLNDRLAQFVENSERHSQVLATTQAAAQAETKVRMEQNQTAIDKLTKQLGEGLTQQTEKTGQTLKQLHERLAVIDTAQKNITGLSEQMVSLQDILSNKQARGAFGEIQLNDLVSKILPPSAYKFQATLSNNKRADCLIDLPNPPGPIVIDSKFPLEAYQALQIAEEEVDKKLALRALGAAIDTHIQNIKERYIISGETADAAIMFLPSEAIFAVLHTDLQATVDKSYRDKVYIVSPTTLWAMLNTVRAVFKDVHMREQASVIQKEVMILLEDVGRLDKRVSNLQNHMRQADDDLRQISTSSEKVTKRGERISEIEMGEDVDADDISSTAEPQAIEEG
jgi:DNA recombination protein RmuC